MKRLLKHEWKYYLIFMILLITVLLYFMQCYYIISNGYDSIYEIDILFSYIDGFFYSSTFYTIIIFLIFKTCFAVTETSASTRGFLQMLPVSKRKRLGFHIIMDTLTIVISYLIATLPVYFNIKATIISIYSGTDIIKEIYYSFITNYIVSILYLVCIASIYYVVSTVVVIGWAKTFFSIAAYATLATIFEEYGYQLANRQFSPVEFTYNFKTGVYYISHLDNFAIVSTIYGCIAIVLIIVSIWLSDIQDEANELFYISWIKYIFAAIPAFYCFAFYYGSSEEFCNASVSGIILTCLSMIIIFLFFAYLLTPDRQKPTLKKAKPN